MSDVRFFLATLPLAGVVGIGACVANGITMGDSGFLLGDVVYVATGLVAVVTVLLEFMFADDA